MAKISGIPVQLQVDNSLDVAVDISGDVQEITVNTSVGSEDVTGLDVSALERLLLLTDAEVSIKGTFNELLSHTVFANFDVLKAGEVGRSVTITYPGPIHLDVELVFESYVVVRAANGALTWTVSGRLADGTVPTWA
ncbi:hypothetical protein MUP35_00750 [Patescibacteria group bacterium]|nr:hypothetical protein [Patescibacteria group bacterium]